MTAADLPGDLRVGGELRVGIDLAAVAEVAASIERFGARYLDRVYTAHERECCDGEPTTRAAGLAARFAAKEATLKVLRPDGTRPDWRSIEVRRAAGGWTELHLSGAAASQAAVEGVRELSLSMTHEGPLAAAVVVARCEGGR